MFRLERDSFILKLKYVTSIFVDVYGKLKTLSLVKESYQPEEEPEEESTTEEAEETTTEK